MWCFVDESWHDGANEKVGVLAAAIGSKSDFDLLETFFYRIRKKYYGEKNAHDLRSELKGTSLLSNQSFKQQTNLGYSKNLALVREILEWLETSNIRLVGVTIYGDSQPPLLANDLKALSTPFKELCVRILSHLPDNAIGNLVFDQRLGAQENISISVYNYLAGIKENKRLNPHPMIGVSNVWPGLQLADIVAYILGRYATSDNRFGYYYNRLSKSQIDCTNHRRQRVFGFLRLQWEGDDRFSIRKLRTKK